MTKGKLLTKQLNHPPWPMQLLVATSNPHKLRELAQIVGLYQQEQPALELQLMGLHQLDETLRTAYVAEETAPTLLENAHTKAEALYRLTGRAVIAEDTGLEVDALGGRPGVKSARYAPTDSEKIAKLLQELTPFPEERERTARFVTCLCYLDENGNPMYFIGKAEGVIAQVPEGQGGFGYDPIFISRETGRSFAMMPAEEKNRLSHRARAMRGLLDFLLQWQLFRNS